ncbi:hypothetical protein NIB75_25920 [Bacteroides uniformis]|nr:hypothetical protein [Bacteroides uniformis]
MSPQKVLWLFMQGFTTKYDLCKAERGDFVGNRRCDLEYKKDMTSTFATQFSSRQTESWDARIKCLWQKLR